MLTAGEIDDALDRAERAAAEHRKLDGTGFWKAVATVKGDPELIERFAGRIGDIDRAAFENGVKLRIPVWYGLLLLLATTAFGAMAVASARLIGGERFFGERLYDVVDNGRWFVPIALVVGTGALLIGTHCWAHFIVGRLVGIRFTHMFLGGPKPPRPGLKTDYATYLRATPKQRAAMHSSGAIVTKLVPFALLAATIPMYDEWAWLTWLLVGLGVLQIVTDIFVSTKVSDWKKVRRELRAAR